MLGDRFELSSFKTEQAKVSAEYNTPKDGRIDILISDGEKGIIIENKLDAEDQPKQLERYDDFAEKEFKPDNYQIFYLSLDGKEASEQSAGDVHYQVLSYEKDILQWLENSLVYTIDRPFVRETIRQYINSIKQLTQQDMNTELIEYLADIEKIRLLKTLSFGPSLMLIAEKNLFSKLNAEFKPSKWLNKDTQESLIQFEFSLNNQVYALILNGDKYVCRTGVKPESQERAKALIQEDSKWFQHDDYLCIEVEKLDLDIWQKEIVESDNFLNKITGYLHTLIDFAKEK